MRLILTFLFAFLMGCPATLAPVCDETTPCTGFGEQCVSGQCVTQSCATSAQCQIENYCESGKCIAGCVQDDDCKPGYTCDTTNRVCQKAPCTNTNTDCGFKQFCNQATGDCYDAGQQYCKRCQIDTECGAGNYCIDNYCTVDCSGGRECPADFSCTPLGDGSGNVIGYGCFTYCWLYDGYAPGSFEAAPPPRDLKLTIPDHAQAATTGTP
jgi:hypothetical protein